LFEIFPAETENMFPQNRLTVDEKSSGKHQINQRNTDAFFQRIITFSEYLLDGLKNIHKKSPDFLKKASESI